FPRDGLVIVAKRDCPTCVLVEPVMQSLDRAGPLTVVSQDDPSFPSGVRSVVDDQALERSFRLNIEAVPTLIRFKDGREVERIVGMLAGTDRKPDEIVGNIPPNLAPCTVEKVAINAVMAGCKPEYMPVVLGVLEAALDPLFVLHGLLCTTHFAGPLVIINGPVARQIGMNSGVNALGQGNRANAAIGRALQLIVRNVGGGIPGAIDRATLGNPGKYTF